MIRLEHIETERETNEGFTYQKTEGEIIKELVEGYNELLDEVKTLRALVLPVDY